MIHSIVFDMGNVLIHWAPEIFVGRLGVSEEDQALLLREVFQKVEWIRLDRGAVTHEEAIQGICRRLPPRLHGCVETLVRGWWKPPLIPVEGMGDLVREVKTLGYGVYLLSNASRDLHSYFSRLPESQCFDGCFVSADWRLLKPQPEIFQRFLAHFKLRAQECFFIDDNLLNVEAAVDLGFSAAVFQWGLPALRQELIAAGIPVRPATAP